jgi:hypothetical protein
VTTVIVENWVGNEGDISMFDVINSELNELAELNDDISAVDVAIIEEYNLMEYDLKDLPLELFSKETL